LGASVRPCVSDSGDSDGPVARTARRRDQCLRRHAARVQTIASEQVFFDQRDACAEARRPRQHTQTSRPPPIDEGHIVQRESGCAIRAASRARAGENREDSGTLLRL
jgi:hypothetical protein